MNAFKDFQITSSQKQFTGDKIDIDRIMNKEIVVADYKVEPSKFINKGSNKCLTIQIEYDSIKRIVFTGSANLINQLEQIPKDGFPFRATIIKENKMFQFT